VTSGQSDVQVEMTLGDEAALGTMLTAKGRNLPLRMTRLALSELAELKDGAAAGKRMDAIRFKADTRIVLIYVGAGDCPSCRRYELEYFHPRNGKMKDVLPEFDAIEYVKGHLASFRTGRIDSVLPSDLAPLARPGPDGAKRPFSTTVLPISRWSLMGGSSPKCMEQPASSDNCCRW